jgi:hypothetical protein
VDCFINRIQKGCGHGGVREIPLVQGFPLWTVNVVLFSNQINHRTRSEIGFFLLTFSKYLLTFIHNILEANPPFGAKMRLSTCISFLVFLFLSPLIAGDSSSQTIFIRILRTVRFAMPDGSELVWKADPTPKKVTSGTVGGTKAKEVRVESSLWSLNGDSEPGSDASLQAQKRDVGLDLLTPPDASAPIRVFTLTDE